MIVQRFNLNLIPNQSPVIVHVNQYDTGTGRLIATLYEGNEPYSPNGTAVIQGTKPDGHGFQYTATLDGNVVTADLTEQMAPVAGDVRTQIVVTESSGVTGTFAFIIRVQPSALPSDTEMSESDYQYIEEAIREAQEAVQTAQEATETAQEAVERAQEAITETQENAEDSEAWAQGTRGGIPVGPTDPTYEHNAEYWAQYAERYAQGGLHYKGSILFANIPTTGMREGDMYNITDDFTTDSRFEEGAGIEVKGGTNIAWDSDDKWDILALPYIPKTTFNGRSGSILPMAGDYDSKKILLSSALHIGGETQSDVQEALEALSDDGVKLFNGRSGSVLPMAGDYDSEKILLASVLHIGGETQDNVQKALEALEGNKADKVDNAIEDNFAGFDADGNLKDSGKNAGDFATPSDIAGQQSLVKDTVGWTGKNLAIPNSDRQTAAGITYTKTSKTITANGTASGSNSFCFWSENLPWLNEPMILTGCPAGGSSDTYQLICSTSDDGATVYVSDVGNGVLVPANTNESNLTLTIYVRIKNGATVSNKVFYPMICKADITDPTYEPYHESVEVMYEEEIHGVNLAIAYPNYVLIGDSTQGFHIEPNRTGGLIYIAPIKHNTSYIASKAQVGNRFRIVLFKNEPSSATTRDARQIIVENDTDRTSYEFKNTDFNYAVFATAGEGGGGNVNTTNGMIRKADIEDSTYRPYNPQAIQNQLNSVYENGAVNHLDNKATNRTISGITFTVDDNKIIYANGTSANSGDTPQIAMPVSLPKGRWAYSGCPDGGSDQKWDMILWDNTASLRLVEGSLFNSNDRLEFEITDANVNHSIDAYIRVKKGGVVCNNIAFKPMIAPASYTGHYVPYAMTNKELTENKVDREAPTATDCNAFTDQFMSITTATLNSAYKQGLATAGNGFLITAAMRNTWNVQFIFSYDGHIYKRTVDGTADNWTQWATVA